MLTVTKETLTETDVLIKDRKISQIGKAIAAPQGTQVIDATGLFVMPGIIDAHSHIALDQINEGTNAITPEVHTADALNPFQVSIYRALAGGCTTSHALHGSANSIGGQSQTIKHRWGTYDPQVLKMEGAPRTIKFALGENPTGHGRRDGTQPQTRMGVEFVIPKAFSEAGKARTMLAPVAKTSPARAITGTIESRKGSASRTRASSCARTSATTFAATPTMVVTAATIATTRAAMPTGQEFQPGDGGVGKAG